MISRRPLNALVLASITARCSLIVDVERVRDRRDAGGDDAPAGEDQSPNLDGAAGDGGPDAGFFDGGAPDGGAGGCHRPEAGVLQCQPPITLETGDVRLPSIAALNDRFVLAYAIDRRLERRTLTLDARVEGRETLALPFAPVDLALAASGEHWALIYGDGAFLLACRSSLSSSTTNPRPIYEVDSLAIAVSPAGSVAIAAARPGTASSSMHTGLGADGCPSQLAERSPWFHTRGVSAAHVAGGGPLDFRFGLTSVEPIGMDSAVLMIEPTAMMRSRIYDGTGMGRLTSVVSSDGRHWISAFANREPAGTTSLAVTALRSDLAMGAPVDRVVAPTVTDFDLAACGPGCVVAAYLADVDRGRLSLAFYDDTAALGALGAGTYDLQCGQPAAGAEVDVASARGTIGVLYTDGNRLDLVLCQLPAF